MLYVMAKKTIFNQFYYNIFVLKQPKTIIEVEDHFFLSVRTIIRRASCRFVLFTTSPYLALASTQNRDRRGRQTGIRRAAI